MSPAQKKALIAHRRRLKRRGIARLEVRVREGDAALLRGVVEALADPARRAEARAVLRERFARNGAAGLKALLAAAPLDGVDLERGRDTGRKIDL